MCFGSALSLVTDEQAKWRKARDRGKRMDYKGDIQQRGPSGEYIPVESSSQQPATTAAPVTQSNTLSSDSSNRSNLTLQ